MTGAGNTYQFTFTAPGTYQYDCAVHGHDDDRHDRRRGSGGDLVGFDYGVAPRYAPAFDAAPVYADGLLIEADASAQRVGRLGGMDKMAPGKRLRREPEAFALAG